MLTENERLEYWRRRWLGADGKPQARLCFLEDPSAWIVYDSHAGEEREREIGTNLCGVGSRPSSRP